MLTTGEIQQAAARRMRRIIAGLVALVLVLVVLVVGLLTSRSSDPVPAARNSPQTAGGALATAPPAGYMAPARWVVLPAGAERVDEYPVRFPHTPEGAAAMMAAAIGYGTSMDPQTVARVSALYVAPQDASSAQALVEKNAQSWRRKAGVPLTGPLPDGASVTSRPIAVQWQASGPDRVRVNVLHRAELASSSTQPPQPLFLSGTFDAVWVPSSGPNGGDWRYTLSKGMIPPAQPAEIGTAEFNAAGWTAIQETRG